jgi:hypothetical protein
MSQKFAIAARSALMANIAAGDTSLTVDITKADLFPVADTNTSAVPTVGKDFFKIVLEDSSHNIEIVYVRTRALGSASMTNLLRGQEGTTARAYLAGSIVGLRHTAADLADAIDLASTATAFGKSLLTAATAALARTALGATVVGDAVFRAVDAAAALLGLGATTVGTQIFTAVSAAAARLALSVAPRAARVDVASVAGVVDLTTNAPDTDDIQFTGNNAMTGFTAAVGRVFRFVVAAGATPSFVNGANLITQRGANIQLAGGCSGELRVLSGGITEVLGGVAFPGSVTPLQLSQPPTLGTAQATTSGTSNDFTGIPSWVKTITVMLNGVSTNGIVSPIIQLGSGPAQTTGYTSDSSALSNGASVASANYTTGIGILSTAAANVISGHILLTNVSGNTWIASGIVRSASGLTVTVGGSVTLSGALDRIRLTTFNGTDAFDGGSWNTLCE